MERQKHLVQRFCHPLHLQQMSTASKLLCFSCRGSPVAWILDGEVDLSLNDSPWAQRKWSHGTEQFLRLRQPECNLLPPTSSSSSFPPACIPQPPAQVQPLPSSARGLPLPADTSHTWDLLATPRDSCNYVVDSLDRQAEVMVAYQGHSVNCTFCLFLPSACRKLEVLIKRSGAV